MNTIKNDPIVKAFSRMGADVDVMEGSTFAITVVDGGFQITKPKGTDLLVSDVQKKNRHLLLVVRDSQQDLRSVPPKILCGHDERHWFSAVVTGPVTNVQTAMKALLPPGLRGLNIQSKDLGKHKGKNWRRQGEWYFVLSPRFTVDDSAVKHNEPLQRDARSKPHTCEFLYGNIRSGRSVVIVGDKQYGSTREAQAANPGVPSSQFQMRALTAEVYVKGRISHPDHATIVLTRWHRVYLNTEAFGLSGNMFLD